MRNNPEDLRLYLQRLGLTSDEATIYMDLVKTPKTLLGVSRTTGIVRSNVYRIADKLIEKGILYEVTTDSGKLFASAAPETLELLVVEQELTAETRRADFRQLLPLLDNFKEQSGDFAIKTYSGVSGTKQMLWNELKTTSEVLLFSRDSLDLLTGRKWAERYRAEIISRGIQTRSIENIPSREIPLSEHKTYTNHYHARFIAEEILAIKPEVSIHDDTISLYNSWTHETQLGTEVKNAFLAAFMRQMFEHYWSLAKEIER